jgi:serine O-acetyltransferase
MIKTREDYIFYREADRIAKSIPSKPSIKSIFKSLFFPDYIWEFQKTLRKLEYYTNCKKGFFFNLYQILIKIRFRKLSHKLGFSIPINVFGPGLSIAHYGTIIVNAGAKVGSNCRLHACVNIGTSAGHSTKAPKIGDNCYIGPGAKIYGDIVLPNGIAIGANSVVNKTFVECNIAIAGAPATKIAKTNPFEILIPATLILKNGISNKHVLDGKPAREVYDILKKEKIDIQQI